MSASPASPSPLLGAGEACRRKQQRWRTAEQQMAAVRPHADIAPAVDNSPALASYKESGGPLDQPIGCNRANRVSRYHVKLIDCPLDQVLSRAHLEPGG